MNNDNVNINANTGMAVPTRQRKDVIFYALIFLSLLIGVFLVKNEVTRCGIETSRLAVVDSLVGDGTFAIDNSIFSTSDKVEVNGHFYGDKPPLLTMCAALWYRAVARFTGGFRGEHYHLSVYLVNLLFYFLTILIIPVFYHAFRRYSPRSSAKFALAVAVLSVVSTLVLSYSVTLNNHTICALCLICLIGLLNQPKESTGFLSALCAGILTGTMFNLDFVTGGVFGITVFLYLAGIQDYLLRKWIHADCFPKETLWKRLSGYVLGAFVLIGIEALLNYLAYGSVLPLYLTSHNPDFVSKSYLFYLFNILFGFEGFFVYMPALLWIGFVCCSPAFRKDSVFVLMMLSFVLTVILLVIGTSDYGGWCYGYRFLIPFAPMLLFYIAAYFKRERPRLNMYRIWRLCIVWGILTALIGTCNPWAAGYEGSSTPAGALPNRCKNSFLLNAFVFSWQYSPSSFVTDFFIDHVYGPDIAALCLMMELNNRNDTASLLRLQKELGMADDAE